MATIDTLIDYDRQNPTAISREAYEDVGADAFSPGTFPRAFVDLEVWDAAVGGDQLVLDTDYELVDLDYELSGSHYENELVYKSLRILDVDHQTGFIYLTYNAVGTYATAALHDGTVQHKTVDSDYTILSTDPCVLRVDPTDAAVTITLPAIADVPDKPIEINLRHYGNGLVENGDCESATEPSVDTGVTLTNATFARSDVEAHAGTHSYKHNVTAGGGVSAAASNDSEATDDLHGLVAGETYTLVAWKKSTTADGPSDIAESLINLRYYDDGAWVENTVAQTLKDVWERLSVSVSIPATATGASIRGSQIADTTETDEFVYVDDYRLYRHYGVTVIGPIENVASYILGEDGDRLAVLADEEKYLEQQYHAHGELINSGWHRKTTGEQMTHGYCTLVYVDASTLAATVTLEKAYKDTDYTVTIGGFAATTMTDAEVRQIGTLENAEADKTTTTFIVTLHVNGGVDADDTISYYYKTTGHWR